MFQSRRATQRRDKEIVWDGGVVVLLSSCPKEEKAEELNVYCKEDTALICPEGQINVREPSFGPQRYYDAKEGLTYELKFPGTLAATVLYQHKDWWIRPAFIKNLSETPDRTQLILFRKEEVYFVLLAVCGEVCRTDMRGKDHDSLLIRMAPGAGNRNRLTDLSLVIAAGENPYRCCERAVEEALRYLGRESMLRKHRSYPEMFEYFGWCSWDAFYHQVSHQGILDKMQEFRTKKIPVKWVLVDDGWLSADYEEQTLTDLDARKSQFPYGLYGCVQELKKEYGIDKVGVWHAVMGYWNGVREGTAAHAALQAGIKALPDGRLVPAPAADKAFLFYERWHDYLRNHCGIDFVKVDGQSAISLAYGGMETYGEASREIQKGLNASAALHFENRIINCMGMASEDMWNRPSGAVARSSDDFVPNEQNGFREHVIQNGYNNLLQGQFYWGDWDMFYTDHTENRCNSMLRAVSGGPVYVSDKVGETDPAYLWPLIRKDGRVIRCDGVGMPTMDCLLTDPLKSRKPLKIWNRFGAYYVVAAFSIHQEEAQCEGAISVQDIPGLCGNKWLVYHWFKQKISPLEEGSETAVSLAAGQSELYLILPDGEVQMIGILEKYIGPGCVSRLWEHKDSVGVLVSEPGTFGFVARRKPARVLVDDSERECELTKGGLYTVKIMEENSVVELCFL